MEIKNQKEQEIYRRPETELILIEMTKYEYNRMIKLFEQSNKNKINSRNRYRELKGKELERTSELLRTDFKPVRAIITNETKK